MTAINFNLDKAIAKADTKTVRIGGKDHELVFNDEMRNKLEELQIVVYSEAQAFDDNRDAFINDYTVDDRKRTLKDVSKAQRDNLIKGMDDLLGAGEGQRLYDYYGHSFTKLSAVLVELIKIQDAEDKIKSDDHKHQAKRQRYTHKRG
ncbi:hypothetical protein PO148_08360 [Limosilactobacillus mucosae]|jgi:hypothetical protein|uniref:Uncharacterized protein n=1 Tax=Limosilactobacillus mucosae TaxID=97478 RepID=A0AAJ1HVM5_LIMMU|nr:hypothetical protein [Limosilactobacillus mucosae]MDC2830402.1 hypothetical protein [Limosilactobacillus mucosae]MDC2837976.1 hypothetical protein [Limosilactobacillus mucosae]MDC2849989.1 hypothetical protein [Limosilactobacillus mucosae]MDC2854107.1 hypothetical protein [Limosilactobacillus mucosae]